MKTQNNTNSYSIWAKGNSLYTKIAAELGIGYPEFGVLYALKINGDQTQKEISTAFGLLKPTVNTVVRDLKKRGIVTLVQCTEDKRERLVSLTDIGKIYCDKIIEPILNMENNVFKIIGKERLEQMHELMELYNTLLEIEIRRGLNNEGH